MRPCFTSDWVSFAIVKRNLLAPPGHFTKLNAEEIQDIMGQHELGHYYRYYLWLDRFRLSDSHTLQFTTQYPDRSAHWSEPLR